MTGGNSRLVAVQTVVVGVLMVVVFVTLLQPESETPISSIEGPAGGTGRTELPAPDVYTGADNERGGGPDEPGPGPSGTEGLGLTGPPSEPGDTGYVAPEGEEDKPSEDQYNDSLTRLMLRVG
jgi:hypothetical protein